MIIETLNKKNHTLSVSYILVPKRQDKFREESKNIIDAEEEMRRPHLHKDSQTVMHIFRCYVLCTVMYKYMG